MKDAVFTVDDFAPCGTAADVQRLHREADRLFRAQGNRAGRGRMRADGGLRPEYYPRGLVVSSGEDVPTGHSVRARMVVVELKRRDVDLDRLTLTQANAREGLLASAMSGYLQWLSPQLPNLGPKIEARRNELRGEARKNGTYHDRMPDNFASLVVGLEFFLQFAVTAEAITSSEAARYLQRGMQALATITKRQGALQASEEPTERFRDLLTGVFTAGLGHVAILCGNDRDELEHWGWRAYEQGDGDDFQRVLRPQGNCLGWLDGEDLLLDPEVAYAAIQKLARDQGTSMSTTKTVLWKRLDEKRHLVTRDESADRLTIRRTIDGKRKHVLHLRQTFVTPETGPTGPSGPAAGIENDVAGPTGPVGPVLIARPAPTPVAFPPSERELIEV